MSDQVSPDDIAAVQRCEQAYNRIRDELAKVIVGQNEVIEQVLVADVRPRPRPAGRRAGPGQDAAHQLAGAESLHLTFKRIQFTPDLMPSDVTGTEVIQEDPETPRAGLQVPRRADLRQHAPGRRDQPHAAQDAGRHARSDAGAAGHRRRQDAHAARAVLRAGHAEPAGAGRHLSAARSPARPVPALHQGRLPQRRRGMGDRPPRDDRPARRDRSRS